MKKWFALLLCITLLCSCLPAGAGEADLSLLYPTAAMPITDYMAFHADIMRTIYPDYPASVYLVQGHDGRYVLTDGSNKDGVFLFEWRVRGDQIVGITVSYPNDMDHLESNTEMWFIWCIFAIMPFAIRDGMTYDEAYTRCQADFFAMMRSSGEITSVYGIQASFTRDVKANHMFFSLHGGISQPSGHDTPALGLPGCSAFKAAVTDSLSAVLPGYYAWTDPVETDGQYTTGIQSLGQNPLLTYQEDELLALMISVPVSANDPQEAFKDAQLLNTFCIFVPLLMSHGMTREEAVAACDEWSVSTGFTYALAGAMCGEPYVLDFYGTKVSLDMTTAGGQQFLNSYITIRAGE